MDQTNLLPELPQLRSQIDQIDDAILKLLEERSRLAVVVGAIKRKLQQDFTQPSRESEIRQRLKKQLSGCLPAQAVDDVFGEIIKSSLRLQQNPQVAYLGPKGTYSHRAALDYFGDKMQEQPAKTIAEVFVAINNGNAHFGVVPFENSIAGVVSETQQLLQKNAVCVVDRYDLAIQLYLISKRKELEGIKKVCAHPMALAQCQKWLSRYLPGVEQAAVASNAEAACMAAHDSSVAAVASDFAATLYGLKKVAEKIEDQPGNKTSFVILTHLVRI